MESQRAIVFNLTSKRLRLCGLDCADLFGRRDFLDARGKYEVVWGLFLLKREHL
jgi:hypothetical protein